VEAGDPPVCVIVQGQYVHLTREKSLISERKGNQGWQGRSKYLSAVASSWGRPRSGSGWGAGPSLGWADHGVGWGSSWFVTGGRGAGGSRAIGTELGGSSLHGLEFPRVAGLDGAVVKPVAEISIAAEAGSVVSRAAQLLGLGEHVVDTFALHGLVSFESL
jgi:hypothetical protein